MKLNPHMVALSKGRKRKPTPCTCDAYKFPHRFGGGACTPETRGEYDDPYARADAYEDDWKLGRAS